MNAENIIDKTILGEAIKLQEALCLWNDAPLSLLIASAHYLRQQKANPEIVTWIIDRNVNITNVCCSACLFCNFYTTERNPKAYITTIDEYKTKIEDLLKIGGNQLLLQGGLHPRLGLEFHKKLFKDLKNLYPDIKLHALGPPEIVHVSKIEGISYKETLTELVKSGLDSLPGAGAEILSERVRRIISKNKCSAKEWSNVMIEAHKLGITTSATMMYGHIETIEERLQHLLTIRKIQSIKPKDSRGFISFTSWPFQQKNTALAKRMQLHPNFRSDEYLRLIAVSRLILNNIDNIQASWLTVGRELAQVCLHAGANDLSSIMIEENVVSAAGAQNKMGIAEMENTIREAGFLPAKRDQQYKLMQ